MSLRIVSERPRVMWDDNGYEVEANGTTAEWDWLFDELKDKTIVSIKLIRQLNPGIGLKDAKDAYEAMKPYRQHCSNF